MTRIACSWPSILLASLLFPAASEASVLVGGYWTTEAPLESTLIVNNPRAVEQDARLILYSLEGRHLRDHSFRLVAMESKSLPLSELVAEGEAGSLELHLPEEGSSGIVVEPG